MRDKTDKTERDLSGAAVAIFEVLMATIEGVIVKKENLSSVDFNFVEENDQLDAKDDSPNESCIYCGQEDYGEVNCWANKADESDRTDHNLTHGVSC